MKPEQSPVEKACSRRPAVLLAAGVGSAALVIQSFPGMAEALQWQRSGGACSSLTWLTAHLCHWSWSHLTWDLLAFAVLSLLCLRLQHARYVSCLLIAALFIPLEIALNQPLLRSYRGLSGLDSALMGLAVASMWRLKGRPALRMLALLGGAGFVAKVMQELSTGSTVFVSRDDADFIPAISAHLVGFTCGVLVGLYEKSKLQRARFCTLLEEGQCAPRL